MRISILSVALLVGLGLIFFAGEAKTQMGPGMTGPGEYGEHNYCPYCGQPMWGPGMRTPGYGRGHGMGYQGWRMGPGMMGPRHGMGPGWWQPGWDTGPQYDPRYGSPYQRPQRLLDEKEVRGMLENYLRSTRNPNLKLGKIEDKGSRFEAEILTKDDSLADRIAVDKTTGWMGSIY
jgi:hypothetical protein